MSNFSVRVKADRMFPVYSLRVIDIEAQRLLHNHSSHVELPGEFIIRYRDTLEKFNEMQRELALLAKENFPEEYFGT